MFGDHGFGRGMEIARAGVVAKPGPMVQHCVFARRGKVGNGGEAQQEAFEVGDNRGYLSLL